MTLSILHRITGVALSVGLIAMTIWLLALAVGAPAYSQVYGFMQSLLGRLVLAGFSFAFFFHLCNGIRHLFWDLGKGFEMRQVTASAWSVVVASTALTIWLWFAL